MQTRLAATAIKPVGYSFNPCRFLTEHRRRRSRPTSRQKSVAEPGPGIDLMRRSTPPEVAAVERPLPVSLVWLGLAAHPGYEAPCNCRDRRWPEAIVDSLVAVQGTSRCNKVRAMQATQTMHVSRAMLIACTVKARTHGKPSNDV